MGARPTRALIALRRTCWLAVLTGALGVLTTARMLTPSLEGRGTHVALGLSPCGFLAYTGLPCPTCGLTTAFAHLAHGSLRASLHAHPLGLPLFALTLLLVPAALHHAIRARSPVVEIGRLQVDRVALGLAVALLVSWVLRLIALANPA